MIKIAVVHPKPAGVIGGGEKVSLFITKILSQDHEVEYYCRPEATLDELSSRFGIDVDDGIEEITVNRPLSFKLVRSFRRAEFLKRALCFRNILRQIESEKYELIFFTNQVYDQYRIESPTVQYVNETAFNTKIPIYRDIIGKIFSNRLLKTNKVIFNSEFTKETFQEEGKVVYPPVGEDLEFQRWEEKEDLILHLGRISESKNIHEAMDIAEKTGYRLVIAGFKDSERYLSQLREKADQNQNIEIRTNVSEEEKIELLKKAKFGLSCRRDEPFGLTVVEYAKSGAIPVVPSSAGQKEIVGDYLAYEDMNDAVNTIKDIENNPNKALDKVEKICSEFSFQKFEDKIKEEIREFAR